ncbi:MAG: hypothetical protein Q4F66_11595, partial [Clostridium sp.]|nr:hypothetical protein [Clostridium sp.]
MHLKLLPIKNPRGKISSLFFKSLISYATILLLPILICSFYYVHSYNNAKERNHINQHLILEYFGEQVNTIFQDAINLGSHLQLNNYVVALSNNKNTLNSSPIMYRYYLQKYLASLQISNASIKQINIYFPHDDYIVTPASTYKKSLLPYMESTNHILTEKDWDSIITKLQSNKIICYSSEDKNFITISQTLLADTSGSPLSILSIQIDKSVLLDHMQNKLVSTYPCSFSLINKDGLLLTTNTSETSISALPFTTILDYFESHSNSSPYELNTDSKLIIDYYPVKLADTALITVSKKSEYLAQTTQLLEFMILTILFCIVIGIIFIIYYSRKDYKPISEILHFIEGTGKELDPHKNEYHLIMQMLAQNHDEIEKHRELLKNNYMQKIFSGEIAFSQIPEAVAKQFAFDLPFSSVCIVLLSIDHMDSVDLLSNPSNLTTFIIKNTFQELLSEKFPDAYFCINKNKIIVCINIPEQTPQSLLSIQRLTEQLILFLSDTFKLSLRSGISSIDDKESIPNAYLQASTALEYQGLFETKKVCQYNDIPQKQVIGSISLNTSEYIINLIAANNRVQILEYFTTIKAELDRSNLSCTDAVSCFYFFYQATAKLQLYCQVHYGLQIEALDFLSESFFSQPLSTALSQIRDAYLKTCDEIAAKSETTPNVLWGENICRFIDDNYFDPNMNLNTIAQHFDISPAYLSKKFKEQYQKSIIDYLYEIRISHAL